MTSLVALLADANSRLSWNPLTDLRELVAYHFMTNALAAGTIVAVLAGLVGWFLVLRREAFAGHMLAVVGFPGAVAAVWIGLPVILGYFGFCLAAAATIAIVTTRPGQGGSGAFIGTVQAFALALGLLFASLSGRFVTGLTGLLFGSFLGITDEDVLVLLGIALLVLVLLSLLGRPLLFASIDPGVAEARGLPVRLLSVAFLVLLGAAVAEVSQITGSLLVFALLVMPAAAAQRLSARPAVSAAITVGLALSVTWLALAMAYFTDFPIGFLLTTIAFAVYVATVVAQRGANGGIGVRNRTSP